MDLVGLGVYPPVKRRVLLLLACAALAGCSHVVKVGVRVLYLPADAGQSIIERNLAYAPHARARIDFYRPKGDGWSTVVFVHGGGWTSGDKDLAVSGADVYQNVARFLAANGYGAAVINYRLQPEVAWHVQVDDVRRAAVRASGLARERGGSGDVFLMGHSAGAYLASFAALTSTGTFRAALRGVIAVSGAALDLRDERTYRLGARVSYYEKRFRGDDSTGDWKAAASPAAFVHPGAPPFLVMYSGSESKPLRRQSRLFHGTLEAAGVDTRLVRVPGESHTRIVLTLSRPDKTAGPAILDFLARHRR